MQELLNPQTWIILEVYDTLTRQKSLSLSGHRKLEGAGSGQDWKTLLGRTYEQHETTGDFDAQTVQAVGGRSINTLVVE